MSVNVIELRPDRQLLNAEFEGYKLSLQDIPTFKEELTTPSIDRVLPNNEQYSLLHARIFGLHNHLIGETIDGREYVYYIDNALSINKVTYDTFTSQLLTVSNLWTVPIDERVSGDFNISLKFASNNIALVADGSGMLYILETGNRDEDSKWIEAYGDDVLNQKVPFIIEDCFCVTNDDGKLTLHCLLLSIKREENNDKLSSVLSWLTFSKENDKNWGQIAMRELQSVGTIYYSQIERTCESIYLISDNAFKFILDSEHPIVESEEDVTLKKKLYIWKQTNEDVTVNFKLPQTFDKSLFDINLTRSSITIKYSNDVTLSGEVRHFIDSELSTWAFNDNDNSLELNIQKSEHGVTWDEFIKGNNDGEYLVSELLANEVHQKLAYLCSDKENTSSTMTYVNTQELEECDFEDDTSALIFERVCVTTHSVTHRIQLNTSKYCLSVKTDDDMPLSVALTNDVDACIWKPELTKEGFDMKHIGTLLAFGYVQASKKQRKFTICSPDLSKTVICDSSKHLFIYRQDTPIINGELRNRITSKRIGNIAQQQVISLDNSEIFGAYLGNNFLYILNENCIYGLKTS